MSDRQIIVLAGNDQLARAWISKYNLKENTRIIIATSIRTLEGLTFTFSDVAFVEGWNARSDIQEIMELIQRYTAAFSDRR